MNFQKSFRKEIISDVYNLKELHQLQEIQTYSISFGGNLIAVFVQNSDEEALKKNWRQINSSLSQYLDHFLEDDFSKWNLYVIYLVNGTVGKELQYEIENNTFASRKIVAGSYTKELTDTNIAALISSHIEFSDFDIKTTTRATTKYSSNSIVREQIPDFKSIDETKISEILLLIEKALK